MASPPAKTAAAGLGSYDDEENQFLQDILHQRSVQARTEIDVATKGTALEDHCGEKVKTEEGRHDVVKTGEIEEVKVKSKCCDDTVDTISSFSKANKEGKDAKTLLASPEEVRPIASAAAMTDEGPGAFAIGGLPAAPSQEDRSGDVETGQAPPATSCVTRTTTSCSTSTATLAESSDNSESRASLAVANPVDPEDAEQGSTNAGLLPSATQVDLQQTERNKKQRQQNALKRTAVCVLAGTVLVAATIAAVVGIVLGRGSSSSDDTTRSAPASHNTQAPTSMDSQIISLLPEYTRQALDGPGTPQSKALEWMLQDPNLASYSDERILQRYGMATLYLATTSDSQTWRNSTHWLSYDHHECQWFMQDHYTEENLSLDDDYVYDYQVARVVPQGPCDGGEELKHVWLSENGLQGSLPPQVALLASLQTLDLVSNDLQGSVPLELFTGMPQLEVLWLYSSGITGTIPTQIGRMTSLVHLELLSTSLSGTIPTQIGLLSDTLQVLVVDNSLVGGSLPSELGLLSQMNVLVVGANQFTGTIPKQLGQLSNMFDCCLYGNDLTGALPSELARLEELRFFILESNRLTGSIPSEMGLLSNALWFSIWDNALSGSIPSELGQLATTTHFFLDGNHLANTIPSELGRLESVQTLRLHQNQLTGRLPPQLGILKELQGLYLQNNKLSGSIPPQWRFSNSLVDLRLSHNQLTSTLPGETMGLWRNLTKLLINDNAFSGTVPLELTPILTTLDLRNNSFVGTIPEDLCGLASDSLPDLYCTIGMQECGPYLGFDCGPTNSSSEYNSSIGLCGCGCNCNAT